MRAWRARTVNRLLVAGAAGCVIAAGGGMATAKADTIDDYVGTNAHVVCSVLDDYPSVEGVEGVVAAIVDDGLNPVAAGQVIARSVIGLCPRHMPELKAFIAKYTAVSEA